MRVLLIEDDREAARLLARGLREEGWVVDIAHSGESGDEMASVNTYDAIVLDWLLPDRDGIAVCRSLLRKELPRPSTHSRAFGRGAALAPPRMLQ